MSKQVLVPGKRYRVTWLVRWSKNRMKQMFAVATFLEETSAGVLFWSLRDSNVEQDGGTFKITRGELTDAVEVPAYTPVKLPRGKEAQEDA